MHETIRFTVVLAIALVASSRSEAAELIEVGDLGSRGIIFEAPLGRGGWAFGGGILNPQGIGDFNGDGFDDLAFAIREDPENGFKTLVLIHGRPDMAGLHLIESELPGTVFFRLHSDLDFAISFVSTPGDINGDGYADFLIGVEGGGALIHQGVTYLLYGKPDLPGLIELVEEPLAPDGVIRIFGEGAYEQAGRPGPAGDFNSDGRSDFIIGAPGFQEYGAEAGNVFIIFGGALPDRIALRQLGRHGMKIDGGNILGGAGFFAGPAGDLDGDGLTDLTFSENAALPGDIPHVYVIYNMFRGVPFVRGDSNSDGLADISDAIFTLHYLFVGGFAPLCDDAADANDSGRIDITDAIFTLNALFVGTEEIPEPYPEAGDDPTADPKSLAGLDEPRTPPRFAACLLGV